MRKRLFAIVCSAIAALSLCGCTRLDEYVVGRVNEQAESELSNKNEYVTYKEYLDNKPLADDGTYAFTASSVETADDLTDVENLIPVTIAKNSFLSCSFSLNGDETLSINEEVYYLDYGDSLYAKGVSVNNFQSNLYTFSKYRIWSYDADGRKTTSPYAEVSSESGILLTIPQDYNGSGFSIEPLGSYTNRNISVEAYFLNNDGKQQTLKGDWILNSKTTLTNTEKISINPVIPYTIVYDYSAYSDDYYFVSSSPQCWYSKESEYTVIFQEASSNEDNTKYSVEMHQYITMEINNKCLTVVDQIPLIGSGSSGIITDIVRNNVSLIPEKLNEKTFNINKLKVGDKITIRVGKEYKITSSDSKVDTAIPLGSNAENGYEYTLTVPDTNKGIHLEVTERNSNSEGKYNGYFVDNGSLILHGENNSVIKAGDELPADSERVVVEIIPDNGYYISGKNVEDFKVYRKTMKYSDFEKNVSTIISEHPITEYVTITLDYKDDCGTCVYNLDGNEINGSIVSARNNQKLELVFTVKSPYKIQWANRIVNGWNNFWGNDTISDKINITSDMNNKTISRKDFSVAIEGE